MNEPATFAITRNGAPMCRWELAAGSIEMRTDVEFNEIQTYGFEISGREPDTDYRVMLGDYDVLPESAVGLRMIWRDDRHFEGIRGAASLLLACRNRDAGTWRTRARIAVSVTASKLSDVRYKTMMAQLRRIASGLIFDLYSKSLRSIDLGRVSGGVSNRSNLLELRLLEGLWERMAVSLRQISVSPATRIAATRTIRMTDGGDRLDQQSLARMGQEGISPRRTGAARPFRADVMMLAETTATPEHRQLLGLLSFLRERLRDCLGSIIDHARTLEEDRRWRDNSDPTSSLYATEDSPRLTQLNASRRRAENLLGHLAVAANAPYLRGLPPAAPELDSPVFEHIHPYRMIRDEFRRYLRSSLVVLDDGVDERLKSTNRLYEQWAFFQVAIGLRHAGLSCLTDLGVFQRPRRLRFTLDLDRGARLTFEAADGRTVSLRYEPWIYPEPEARQRGESVYKGKKGSTAWSPDIFLEFFTPGRDPNLEYAVVLDAKYTGRSREHDSENTDKYLDIRNVRTRRAIVKQIWRLCPDPVLGIQPRDDSITWTTEGPDVPREENIIGTIGLAPAEHDEDNSESTAGRNEAPCEVIIEYIKSLLKYLDVPVPLPVINNQ